MNISHDQFRSPRTLSLLAIAGIGVFAFCQIGSAIIGVAQLAGPAKTIKLDAETETSIWMALQGLIAVLQFPVYVFAAVTFLLWLFRTYKNLEPLGSEYTKFSPGWSVGWWFIPLANLVMPFKAVRGVWAESDPDSVGNEDFLSGLEPSAPFFMSAWWAFWIIANIFTNITTRVLDPADVQGLEMSGYAFIIGGIFWVVDAAFAIKLLLDVTDRQERRFVNIGIRRPQEPPPPPTFSSFGTQQ